MLGVSNKTVSPKPNVIDWVFDSVGSGLVRVAVNVTTFDEIPASRNAFAAVIVGVPAITSVEEASVGVKTVPVWVVPAMSLTTIPSGRPGHE
jgi:hypothetical protein